MSSHTLNFKCGLKNGSHAASEGAPGGRGGGVHPGADPEGGIKPPYLPKINGYPSKLPLHFLDERMMRKGEEEDKGRKKKRWEMSLLYMHRQDSPLVLQFSLSSQLTI